MTATRDIPATSKYYLQWFSPVEKPFALSPSKGERRWCHGPFLLRQAQHERTCMPETKNEGTFLGLNYRPYSSSRPPQAISVGGSGLHHALLKLRDFRAVESALRMPETQ